MKAHTTQFKTNIARLGRELDSIITYTLNNDEIELGSEELNSVTPHYEGAILKSVMKQLDIDSNVEIPIGTELNYQFGVKVRNNNVLDYRDNYDYINYGNYIVKDIEKQEDTNSYKITCYDKMLYSMKEYKTPKVLTSDVTFESGKNYYEKSGDTFTLYDGDTSGNPSQLNLYEIITYPITIRNYINAICDNIGLTFADTSNQFANYSKTINSELYLDTEGNTLNYTFRGVLDELAQATASTICINENDELKIRYIKNLLPDEYQQVEYIAKSEDTQRNAYIDTGLHPNEITKIEFDATFDAVSQSGGNHIIGGYYGNQSTNSQTHYCPVRITGSNKVAYGYDNAWKDSTYVWNVGDRHTVISIMKPGEQTIYIDGNIIIHNTSDSQRTETTRTVPIGIYQYQNNRYANYGFSGKFYYFKIYGNNNQLIRNYIPCIRKSDNEVGMYDLVNNIFYTTATTTKFTAGNNKNQGVDEINEEYLKDINVNFGEKFGPVNTIVLSRGGDGDKISLSQPTNLPNADKVAIQISDNQIMNGNDRDTYMADILNKLYGLEYYMNDYSSTGICYLDLCDRYDVKIGNNTYSCIMLNDEVNITQGLQELVYTEAPEEKEQDYKYMSSTDRNITKANIIANKNEATITEYTQKVDDVTNRLNAVETKQTATDVTIGILGTNIDDEGNITAVKVKEGFTFDEDGLQIYTDDNSFKTVIDEQGTYYYDGTSLVGQYTKDGSLQKNLTLFGTYYYGLDDINDTPMFVAQLYNDNDGVECFGHFYNRGD